MISAVNQALEYGQLFDATETFLLHFTTVNARLANGQEFPSVSRFDELKYNECHLAHDL